MWNGMMEYNRRMEWNADKLDDFNMTLTPYKNHLQTKTTFNKATNKWHV